MPFALDTLPECFDEESNNDPSHAQKVKLPIIVNGRIDRPDDWDVFQVEGRAGETIVAEVHARRLDSPLDSVLKLTDATGKLLAFNDDHEDAGSGLNTHHADSYLMVEAARGRNLLRSPGRHRAQRRRGVCLPPADQRAAARFRVARRAVQRRPPQQVGSAAVSVYAIRKDGFAGDIKLSLKDPPEGFSASHRHAAGKPRRWCGSR